MGLRIRTLAAGAAALLALAGATAVRAQAPSQPVRMGLSGVGQAVFLNNCRMCHVSAGEAGDSRAPRLETLRDFSPERIYDALTKGPMRPQGEGLSDQDKREVAEWLSARFMGAAQAGDAASMPNRCKADRPMGKGAAWNGWSADAGNGRFQGAAAAGLKPAEVPRLKLRWAFGFPSGVQVFSQPTVVGGRLFVGSDSGQVYALDADTGCVRWSYLADSAVRTAPVVEGGLVYVGDLRSKLYALDAATGRLVWSARADEQPLGRITAAPAYDAGKLYVAISSGEEGSARLPGYECCRHRGAVAAFDAATGRLLWKTYMVEPAQALPVEPGKTRHWGPAGGAIWATPTVDAKRGRLYATTGDAYSAPATKLTDAVVALDLKTGAVVWSYQDTKDDVWVAGCTDGAPGCAAKVGPDWDFAAPAVLRPLPGGREVLVAAHKGGTVIALDPDRDGAVVWRTPLAAKPPSARGDITFGGAVDERAAYFPLQETTGVVSLDLKTGARRWTVPTTTAPDRASHAGAAAAASAIPGVLFVGAWDGVLRAYSTADGRELWRFDTVRAFPTVNGVAAKGGSMGGPGPTVVGGMVYVGSGYVGVSDGMAGNVLLAFGL